jgi:maltose alpha-D-glucosyltransferase/alpha-amylase
MSDTRWYKDAVIYQLHVRTFADGNGDGIGDFRGLIGRLDHLARLGVTCVWLLPFYESPLRDDGYDISHYERVHPAYGSMGDVDEFLAKAHQLGMRVITELVINHTSDQHPWFQSARRAPAGSDKRDFYVWSDTPDRYAQARIIFSDAESSNWTWDPVAGAYYWHRFFHHQPDLNFDNPHVRLAVLKVMRFWLDKGVDGLRLDAIAHLYEREGTSCDNLPETHAMLKWLRADIDARHGDRVLLAEANQPPAILKEYFGDGDECHMEFAFPLVARLFEAFADQRATPIVDVLRQTSGLPASCQWAVFLRNHDDLSLSALGAETNDRLMEVYAPEEAMRLHGGIRRRLAPMLGNDSRRIELAHALLCSLPGSPVIYYGDEIGMSDRVDLPDRDGLRLPMPWNVVASAAEHFDSLLNRVASLLRVRRDHSSFGRGTITFEDGGDEAILAFRRLAGEDALFAAFNLSSEYKTMALESSPASLRALIGSVQPASVTRDEDGRSRISLPPYGWGWWKDQQDAEA